MIVNLTLSIRRAIRRRLTAMLFNSSRYYLARVNAEAAQSVPAGSLVLDAGAGQAPYRHLFQHARYEAADFGKLAMEYGELTYTCDLRAIPVENERFDFVLFNQTLEHIPEPKEVLRELNRVMKTNARILYTGPLFYEEHAAPYDFYRYTQFGLRYLFDQAGFEVQSLEWLEGYFGTLGYQLQRASECLPLRAKDYGGGAVGFAMVPCAVAAKICFALMSAVFYRMDRRIRYTASGYPKNYYLFAVKRAATQVLL